MDVLGASLNSAVSSKVLPFGCGYRCQAGSRSSATGGAGAWHWAPSQHVPSALPFMVQCCPGAGSQRGMQKNSQIGPKGTEPVLRSHSLQPFTGTWQSISKPYQKQTHHFLSPTDKSPHPELRAHVQPTGDAQWRHSTATQLFLHSQGKGLKISGPT